jgi:very-short-patch-repair endonuclease
LRKNPTNVERLLWQQLRFWQIDGYKFRYVKHAVKRYADYPGDRQQPLGFFIVDFVCLEKRLMVELDGGQHAQQENYDAERDAWLRNQGFTVVRFWNNDVLTNMDGVVATIAKTLQRTPYLNPSPQGGRRKIRNANI